VSYYFCVFSFFRGGKQEEITGKFSRHVPPKLDKDLEKKSKAEIYTRPGSL
jgi:hypothetical protein